MVSQVPANAGFFCAQAGLFAGLCPAIRRSAAPDYAALFRISLDETEKMMIGSDGTL